MLHINSTVATIIINQLTAIHLAVPPRIGRSS